MRTSCPLRRETNTSSEGIAKPEVCSSSERILPRSELPGTYGRPNASLTTGLSLPPISSEPLPAPTWSPVSQSISPSRISFPISFNSVWVVCALITLLVVGHDGDRQRALASAYMEPGFTEHFAFEDQLPDQFQLGLGGMCAHYFTRCRPRWQIGRAHV